MSKVEDTKNSFKMYYKEVPLSDVADAYTGKQLNKSAMSNDGLYAVINGGVEASGYTNDYNEEENTITISQGGASAGFVNWNSKKIWIGAHCYAIHPKDRDIDNRFLYFVLKEKQEELMQSKEGAGIPGINRTTINKLLIPLPHIKVQEEIVKILDSFTNLIDALNEELSLRQKQFEYYREKLLTFETTDNNVIIDVLENIAPYSKKRIKSEYLNAENYVGVDNLLQNKEGKYKSTSIPNSGSWTRYDEGDVLVGNIRPYLKKIWFADRIGGASGDVLVFSLKDKSLLHPKYLYYLLSSDKFFEYDNNSARGAGMPRGDKKVICRYPIAFPKDKAIQQSIVSKLDAFESLISSLKEEIALRQKQYEYYREKLLTFE